MNTAEIEVFLVLAEELHFGRTAERLCLQQPRVSRLVARLERRAGGVLFDRTSRRVRLTPLGEQLRGRLQLAYGEITAAIEGGTRGLAGNHRGAAGRELDHHARLGADPARRAVLWPVP